MKAIVLGVEDEDDGREIIVEVDDREDDGKSDDTRRMRSLTHMASGPARFCSCTFRG